MICRSLEYTSYFSSADHESGVIDVNNANVPHAPDSVTIEDCEIFCDSLSYYMDGVTGHGFTLRHCNAYHVQDDVPVAVP